MKVSDAIESLQRFPQDAELIYDGSAIRVHLVGCYVVDENDQCHVPAYQLDADSRDLPWLWDKDWLEAHRVVDWPTEEKP